MPLAPEDSQYSGSELELFTEAVHWRAYWQRQVARFIGVDVLEVGAGIGTITRDLARPPVRSWMALEPDSVMAARLEFDRRAGRLPAVCRPRPGTIATLGATEQFDTVIYIDVLEHIDRDADELRQAARHLAPGGHLIVLVPAHQILYTPFDAAVGHFRRYAKAQLVAIGPRGMQLCLARYLDSIGLLASLGNRLVLRSSVPTRSQIRLWDRVLVRLSRIADPIFRYRLGKTVIAVWQKSSGK
jgi:SAM-dependent methyltransferase